MRVLSRLFRRRFLEELDHAHRTGRLQFFGEHAALADAGTFARWLAPLRQCEWVVYAKRPFAGPAAVLAYLSRYTHRVAISNSRLLAMDERGVTFRWKDYRAKGRTRHKTMTLGAEEFMRRFLLHVLPGGFHRIRHYGLLANGARTANLALARALLNDAPAQHAHAAHADTGTGTAPAVLRVPALRCPDAHRRDLRARPDDPRATAAAARIMSAIVYQLQIVPSPLVRHSRFGIALPLRRDRDLACSPPHRTTRRFGADAACLIDVTDWFIGGVAIASSRAGAQIPIAI